MPATLHAGRDRIVKCTSYLGFMFAALATTRLILSLLAVDFSVVFPNNTTERGWGEWDELGKMRDAFAVDSARLRAAPFFLLSSFVRLCCLFTTSFSIRRAAGVPWTPCAYSTDRGSCPIFDLVAVF